MKLCACGCGKPAPIASRTNNGYRKGEVMRYLPNHYKITPEESAKRSAKLGTLAERFWRHVDKNGPTVKPELGPCWIWLLGPDSDGGYGRFTAFGERDGAHRVAYRLTKGEIPVELQIDHLCRNRICVNPDHLEPLTIGENVLRGEGITALNSRKTHCSRGHEFTFENTKLVYRNGHSRPSRKCRACIREEGRTFFQMKKERKESVNV